MDDAALARPAVPGRRIDVSGFAAPAFGAVRRSFETGFEHGGEHGGALCIIHRGRVVVDLWGGSDGKGRPYNADTLQLVFSATKGAAAFCAALLIELGLLDVARPVAYYWPEFAQEGKRDMPVSWLLSHRGGLAAVDRTMTVDDVFAGEPVVEALAAQRPLWKPGTAHGYHAVTYGFLVGELVKRVTGISLSRFFAAEVQEPLGLDFWVGLPDAQEGRVAPLLDAPPPSRAARLLSDVARRRRHLFWRALTLDGAIQAESTAALFNDRRATAAEMWSATGICTARSLARMYAAALGEVDQPRLISAPVLRAATGLHARGRDRCTLMQSAFGLGFGLHSRFSPFTGPGAFGHYGIGGSFGFADRARGLAVGYVTSQMVADTIGDPQTRAIRAALVKAVPNV